MGRGERGGGEGGELRTVTAALPGQVVCALLAPVQQLPHSRNMPSLTWGGGGGGGIQRALPKYQFWHFPTHIPTGKGVAGINPISPFIRYLKE